MFFLQMHLVSLRFLPLSSFISSALSPLSITLFQSLPWILFKLNFIFKKKHRADSTWNWLSFYSLPQKLHFSSASKSLSLLLILSLQHVASLLFTYHGTRIFRCDLPSKRWLVLLRKLSLVGFFFFPSRSKFVSWRAEAHQVASPIREWSSFSMNPSCCFCDLVSVHRSPSGTASTPELRCSRCMGGCGTTVEPGGTPLVLSTLQLSVSSGLQLLGTPRLRGDPQPCACGPAASLSLFSLQSAALRAHPLTLLTLHRALEKQSGVSPWDLFTLISILAIRFFHLFFFFLHHFHQNLLTQRGGEARSQTPVLKSHLPSSFQWSSSQGF